MSQAVGRPVRVQWMRWDEHGWEPKGPAIVQDLAGAVDAQGKVVAWRHHMWMPTSMDTRTDRRGADRQAEYRRARSAWGTPAITYAYQFPNADVADHGEGKVALLTAWLRSPAQFETTFAMEAFIDEMAAADRPGPARVPFAASAAIHARSRCCRRRRSSMAGRAGRRAASARPPAAGPVTGRGIAWANRDDARVATIADVTVDPSSGQIQVKRVVVAHDCGLVINPDGLKNQIEGNIIQSISRTLHEEVTFDRCACHEPRLVRLSDPALPGDSGQHRDRVREQHAGISRPMAAASLRPARPRR